VQVSATAPAAVKTEEVLITRTVIVEPPRAPKTAPKKPKITRLILPAVPEPPAQLEPEEPGDMVIATFVSHHIEAREFTFVPSQVQEVQAPETGNSLEPFIPRSTFYYPDHEVLNRENGKPTVEL
jgi:hypothetical protein